jgi:non-specific serine/threonine protein kinase
LDAGSIAGAIQDAMGLASFPGLDPMEQVTSALGMGRSLLVLDNFEHLLQNSSDIAEAPLQRHGADVIRELLQRAPKLTCLITSRRRCNLSGERVFTLAPLPTPGRIRNIEALRRNESIRLFEDRARAVKRTFELTYDNAKIVAQLCHLLEGVPLAIEMAAAHIKTHRPEAVLEFVQSSRLERLEDRRSEAEKHHRTLIATFDWGYRLLSPDHQRLFRQLSAFYGGWTEEAAQEVCASDAANRLLDDLQEWSLLEACAEPTMGATTVRYAMLEMQRQYAEAQLEVEERKKLHERHAAFFHKFARSAQQGVNSPQQERWLRGLATEHSNLRAALKWAETSAPDLGLEIAVCLSQFWEIRNHWVEGYAALTNLLKAAEGAPAPLRAQALLAAGNLAKLLGKRDEARACLDASFLLCKDLNDNVLLAKVLNSLGILTQEEDRAEEACAFYQQSLQIKRDQDDVRGIAITLSNLGYAAYHNEDFSEARRALEEAVQILRTLNLKHALANALNNLGGVTLSEGDSENARLLLLESLTIRREIRNKQNIVYSLLEFARLAHAETDGERAVYLLGAAQRLCERTKCRLSVAEQARYDRFRAALGVLLTSASFDAAWRRGYNELLEQVLDDLSDHS